MNFCWDNKAFIQTLYNGFVIRSVSPLGQVLRECKLFDSPLVATANQKSSVHGSQSTVFVFFDSGKLVLFDLETQESREMVIRGEPLDAVVIDKFVYVVYPEVINVYTISGSSIDFLTAIETTKCPIIAFNSTCVAVPKPRGRVAVAQLDQQNEDDSEIFEQHKSEVCALALNDEYLASCSENATLIRCIHLPTKVSFTFRRGIENAKVRSMAFNKGTLLAVVSSTGVIHIYDMSLVSSSLGWLALRNSYLRDGKSICKLRTPHCLNSKIAWVSNSEFVITDEDRMEAHKLRVDIDAREIKSVEIVNV